MTPVTCSGWVRVGTFDGAGEWRPCARKTTDPSGRCPSHRKAAR
jgi:hypothetical protein